MKESRIDAGKAFDFGRTSEDYARYRDIYPQAFYDRILARGLCISGQTVLDLGTGTGVLPRNMAKYGARWIGTDVSANQIKQAIRLAGDLPIEFYTISAEQVNFPAETFDVITACQCFWYFDHERIAENLTRMLKKNGRLLILYMAWLPFEDAIAAQSEKLVLQFSPKWTGAGESMKPISIPEAVKAYFDVTHHEEYKLSVPFTRETWHGRMRSCRGVGASLGEAELAQWDKAHRALLERIAPEHFDVLHYAALAELTVR